MSLFVCAHADIAASCGNEETKCITDIDELLKWTNSLDEKELNA